jgi:hypothetical protein
MSDEQDRAVVDLATILPATTIDPESDVGRLYAARSVPLVLMRHRVFATRRLALDVLDFLPEGGVVLCCSGVEAVSAPFVDELFRRRRDLRFANMNEDVAETVSMVRERWEGYGR